MTVIPNGLNAIMENAKMTKDEEFKENFIASKLCLRSIGEDRIDYQKRIDDIISMHKAYAYASACDEALAVIRCIKPAYSTDTEVMIDKTKVALAITARLK